MLMGGIFALVIVPDGLHFTEPHHIMGLVVIVLTCLQPFNACLRPHAPKVVHRKEADAEVGSEGAAVADKSRGAGHPVPVDGEKAVFRTWIDLKHVLHPTGHAKYGTEDDHANTILMLRFMWEIWHKGSGYIALLLAIITIFLGITMLGKDPAVPPADTATYTLTVLLIVLGVVGGTFFVFSHVCMTEFLGYFNLI